MRKSEHWQAVINNWKESGLYQKSFCQKQNIKIPTLHYWIRKLKSKPEAKARFIAFSEETPANRLELKIGRVKINVKMAEVGQLLTVLDQAGLLYDPA